MDCCAIYYPRKVPHLCTLCDRSMCPRCLAKHFKDHLSSLAMHKVATRLLKKNEGLHA